MTAYQHCDHPGRRCPRIYQAEPAITPARLLKMGVAAVLLWAGIIAGIVAVMP